MLRGTRSTELRWPARKAILVDVGSHHVRERGLDVTAATVAAGDGSVSTKPFRSASGVVYRMEYGGGGDPFLYTRYGLRGIDFE
ncbi:MAG: hypothetical protein ACR2GY_00420 [Phycisphaerales bacterium]